MYKQAVLGRTHKVSNFPIARTFSPTTNTLFMGYWYPIKPMHYSTELTSRLSYNWLL